MDISWWLRQRNKHHYSWPAELVEWSRGVQVRCHVMKSLIYSLHSLPKFEFCAGNLNLTTLRMDGNFGCVH
jgi:hypothetical protein